VTYTVDGNVVDFIFSITVGKTVIAINAVPILDVSVRVACRRSSGNVSEFMLVRAAIATTATVATVATVTGGYAGNDSSYYYDPNDYASHLSCFSP